jgi:hypothetical protein
MKSCQSSIKQSIQQRGRKRYKMEGPKSWQMKNTPKRVDSYRNRNKSSTQRERERRKYESYQPVNPPSLMLKECEKETEYKNLQ